MDRLMEVSCEPDSAGEMAVLRAWLDLSAQEAALKKTLKSAEAELDAKAYDQYPRLTEADIKSLVVDDKWLAALDAALHAEMDHISQTISQRVRALAERYGSPMPELTSRVEALEAKVNRHLEKMGFVWH